MLLDCGFTRRELDWIARSRTLSHRRHKGERLKAHETGRLLRMLKIQAMAESAALAMLETLIHFELAPDEAPADFQLLEVQCPDDIGIMSLENSRLPEGWRDDRPLTQRLGAEWLRSRSPAVLRVPSAIVPKSFNYFSTPCTTRPAACRSGRRVGIPTTPGCSVAQVDSCFAATLQAREWHGDRRGAERQADVT